MNQIDKLKKDHIKHQDLITYEGIYDLKVITKGPMKERIKFAILINELRTDLDLDKLDFKEEVKYLQKHLKVLDA